MVKVAGSILVITDLTEHKQVELALKIEKEKAERYLNIAEVILVALDTRARITLLNRKGYQVAWIQGRRAYRQRLDQDLPAPPGSPECS